MARPGRNVVDMVVARLPPPGKLSKRSGEREESYDDEGGDVGLESAVDTIAKAFGVKLDDEQRADVADAFRDIVSMCMHDREPDEDDEE